MNIENVLNQISNASLHLLFLSDELNFFSYQLNAEQDKNKILKIRECSEFIVKSIHKAMKCQKSFITQCIKASTDKTEKNFLIEILRDELKQHRYIKAEIDEYKNYLARAL